MMATEDELELTSVAASTSKVLIEPGVELEVLYVNLRGRHSIFEKVPVPVDREHFSSLIKYYKNQKNWKLFFQLKNNYPDLRPRDACTVHKAQGSTHNTVFIDLQDLSTCRDPVVAARLLYVAFSRARQRVVLYGNLASKFGGIANS
jgi:hypothetical protein